MIFLDFFFFFLKRISWITSGKSNGSGKIIDADGTILTCAHVVVDFQSIRQSSKGRVSSKKRSAHHSLV